MIVGVATWRAVAAVDGNVLLIVNSPNESEVSNLFDAIERWVPSYRVHVIATREWQAWLRSRGCAGTRVLFATDDAGQELELNFFLESPVAVRWILERQFALMIGSAPHNLYNEEVKDLFERRVGVFLGTSRFLMHTLPEAYVFVLDLSALLRRQDRGRKAAEYGMLTRALVADLHRVWIENGKPAVCDVWPTGAAAAILEQHLGQAILDWNEGAPIPWGPSGFSVVEDFLSYAEGVLHRAVVSHDGQVGDLAVADVQRARTTALQAELVRRDELLRLQHEELTAAVQDRDRRMAALHEELTGAVQDRDRRLAALHDELSRQVDARDRRLRELQDTLVREVASRDKQLAEMREAFTREVKVRDQNLIDMYAERTDAVDTRDAIIDGLRAQLKKRR